MAALSRPAFPPAPKPCISTDLPFSEACARYVTSVNAGRVYVIVSSSISKTANFVRLQAAMGNKIIAVRNGVRPHTPWDDVLEIINEVREKAADIIVTLGAGSLTDGAKLVSFGLANNVTSIDDIVGLTIRAKPENPNPCKIPIINIPTSLSGGEYSPMAGATDMRTGQKNGFAHPSLGADLIILDPALTVSTPERIWLSTGVRAIDHCVEGLCSLDPRAVQHEAACVEGLKLLIPSLLHTRKNWEATEPRLNSMLGVIESTKSIRAGVPMGGSHGIGHQLGPLGVGHGETSCILLPAVLKYNYRHGDGKVKELQMKLLNIFWNDKTIAGFLDWKGMKKGTADAGDILRAIIGELGMPTTLNDVHVKRTQVDDLANNSLNDTWLQTNAVPLTTKEQVLEILKGIIE